MCEEGEEKTESFLLWEEVEVILFSELWFDCGFFDELFVLSELWIDCICCNWAFCLTDSAYSCAIPA